MRLQNSLNYLRVNPKRTRQETHTQRPDYHARKHTHKQTNTHTPEATESVADFISAHATGHATTTTTTTTTTTGHCASSSLAVWGDGEEAQSHIHTNTPP